MRASKESMPSMTEGEAGKEEMRCPECGTKVVALQDSIQKEDSFVCASCYHSMVYGHHAMDMDVFE